MEEKNHNIKIDFDPIFLDLFRPFRFKAYFGGRGGGKSHAFAEALLVYAMQSKERILCVREIQNSIAESVKRLLEDKIKAWQIRDRFIITDSSIIEKRTGSEFLFRGLYRNLDSIKSLEGVTKCWVEEAQSLSTRSLDFLLPTIRAANSEIWFSWNPDEKTDPVGVMFLGKEFDLHYQYTPPNSAVHYVTWKQNRQFPDVLDQLRLHHKKRDYTKYLHVWKGFPVKYLDANVYTNWSDDIFESPSDSHFLFGADWGFSTSPTVLIRFWVDLENYRIFLDYEANKVGVDIKDTAALFLTVPGSMHWPIIADSSNPQIISHLNMMGFNIKAAKKGKGSVEVGIKWLQDFDIIIHSRCKKAIEEFTNYKYKVDPDTKEPTGVLLKEYDHTSDALRYGSESLIAKGGFETLKARYIAS